MSNVAKNQNLFEITPFKGGINPRNSLGCIKGQAAVLLLAKKHDMFLYYSGDVCLMGLLAK